VGLLVLNGGISITKFGGGQSSLRTVHAYIGTVAVALMIVHAVLGLRLGLAI
jgi:thiosulfate reductase cytochrome b subunit